MAPLTTVRWWAAILLLGDVLVTAQTLIPTNWTSAGPPANISAVRLLFDAGDTLLTYDLYPMVAGADSGASATLSTDGVILADTSNELQITSTDIAVISCDSTGGYISTGDILVEAVLNEAVAVVFYSQTADYCRITDAPDNYVRIYSTISEANATSVLAAVKDVGSAGGTKVSVAIETNGTVSSGSSTSSSSSSSSSSSNPLGPSPTTAVAMIILYSVTGIITALFLTIIVTGAVRAHRHPERYGPRAFGRPRQTRAGGLARAMLDSLPIVKFGERDEAKAADVELTTNDGAASSTTSPGEDADAVGVNEDTTGTPAAVAGASTPSSGVREPDEGIAAAVAREHQADSQGCSICTEDFQVGEDQRVLPCNHRYHPDCIDPWLLNVSGTCPLCRIDLRPATARTSADGSDSDGGMAPPLETDSNDWRQTSIRRNVLGLGGLRADRLSREERVLALRELRGQQLAARPRVSQVDASPEEESNLGRRLRNAFRIRTRRTGEDEGTERVPSPVSRAEGAGVPGSSGPAA